MNDCQNGEDELGCKHNTCENDEFRCEDGLGCVKKTVMCDGINHCLDDSDEKGCPPKAPGNNECLFSIFVYETYIIKLKITVDILVFRSAF